MKADTENKNIPLESINEMVQDAFFFTFFLRMKRGLENIEAKSYLAMFIKGMSSVFIYEFIKFLEQYDLFDSDTVFIGNEDMLKKIQSERQWLKKTIYNSNTVKKNIEEMGIRFDEFLYDINVIIKDNNMLDFNVVGFNEQEDMEFWNYMFYTPEKFLTTLLKDKDWDDMFTGMLNELSSCILELDNMISGKRYSYSSCNLFGKNNDLNDLDKIFTLYRFRLVESIRKISNIFDSYDIVMSDNSVFQFTLKKYLRKFKAIVIDVVGHDLMNIKTKSSKDILSIINDLIPQNFFPINRKVRDNLHYKHIAKLTDEENDLLDKCQKIYLDVVSDFFSKIININIDEECLTMTGFLEECSELKMSKEYMFENYEELYINYCLRKNN